MTDMKIPLPKFVFALAIVLSMAVENGYGQIVDADVTPGGQLVVDGVTYYAGRNIVYNGQFTIQNGNYVPGWFLSNYYSLATNSNPTIFQGDGHDGTNSAAANTALAYIVARWNVTPGRRYAFSFWARNLNATRAKNTVLSLTNEWSEKRTDNNGNAVMGGSNTTVVANYSDDATEWVRTTVVFESGDSKYLQFYTQGAASKACAISDVRLCELTTATPTPAQTAPQVFNGDFVLSTSGWNDTQAQILPELSIERVDDVLNVEGSQHFCMEQTLQGLPQGLFVLKANAFCRPVNIEALASQRYDGTLCMARLFIDDVEMPVRGIADGLPIREELPYDYREGDRIGRGIAFPATAEQANALLQTSICENCVVAFVSGGSAQVGVKDLADREAANWDVADNFTIAYLYNDLANPANDGLAAYLNTLAARPMRSTARENLNAARQQLAGTANETNYRTLAQAINAAQASANSYGVLVAAASRISNQLAGATGVSESVQEEVQAALTQYQTAFDEGTLSDTEVLAMAYEADALLEKLYLTIITVHTDNYGELASKIAETGYSPGDIDVMNVSGKLTSTDIQVIREQMTALKELDMSQVTLPYNALGTLDSAPVRNWTLKDLTSLERVVLPESLNYLDGNWNGGGCFTGCTALREVVIPQGVVNIGYQTFSGCSSLETVELPDELMGIFPLAFEDCSSLSNIVFKEELTFIGADAFHNCDALTSITLPASLDSINGAFNESHNLSTVYLKALVPPRDGPHTLEGFPLGVYVTDVYVPDKVKNSYAYRPNYVEYLVLDEFHGPYRNYKVHGIDYEGQITTDLKIVYKTEIYAAQETSTDFKPNVVITKRPPMSLVGGYNSSWTMPESYGHLTVLGDGLFSVGNFSIQYDRSHLYTYYNDINGRTYVIGTLDNKYCTLISNTQMRADAARVMVNVAPGRWLFFCPPFNVRVGDIQATDGRQVVVCTYSGANRASRQGDTWLEMTADDIMQAGQGYIVITDDGFIQQSTAHLENTVTFDAINDTHKNDIFTAKNVETVLQNHEARYAHNLNWNLVGNPYPCWFDLSFTNLTSPIIIRAEGKNSNTYGVNWDAHYTAVSPLDDDFILKPSQAFFLQKPLYLQTLAFNKEGRQHDHVKRAANAPRRQAKLLLAGDCRELYDLSLSVAKAEEDTTECFADRARIVLNPEARLDYELERDAAKMFSENVPQIYTYYDGVSYDINERSFGDGIVPLCISLPEDGEYTLTLNTRYTDNALLLTDHFAGQEVMLYSGDTYTFTAEAGTTARFTVILHPEANGIVQIDNGTDGGNASQPPFLYDLQGRRIPAEELNTLPSGIYIKGGRKIIIP